MPLYPYRCTKCGHRFEKIQSFNSQPETKCPQCGGPLERVLTAPGLQFKGPGWYVNDYASKGSSTGESSSKDAPKESSKDASTGSGSAESKPAAADKPSAAPAAAPTAKPGNSTS